MTDHLARRREVGHAIVRHRKRAGLTQRQLAEAVGLTRASIANIELGAQNATLDGIFAIADTLGASVRDLMPVDADAPSARAHSPQSDENGSGVGRGTPGPSGADSGPCGNCGHPVRADGSCACCWPRDYDDGPACPYPLAETYPGSGTYE